MDVSIWEAIFGSDEQATSQRLLQALDWRLTMAGRR